MNLTFSFEGEEEEDNIHYNWVLWNTELDQEIS